MRILSLFDGMACGMIAMLNAGVEIESYDAFEIDKYAIKTATHNFPIIKEHGDVFKADFTKLKSGGVDFLIGGSPCTHWSIAQTKNRESTVNRDECGNLLIHSSGIGFELFSQYLRALQEVKPKYFIYENNKSMSKEIRAAITECFGFEPICMQIAEATARGYTEIELGDCVDLSMPNSKTRRERNMTAKANCMQTSNEFYQYVGYAIYFDENGKSTKAIGKNGKEITIYEVHDGKITVKDKQYPIKLKDGFYIIRKLTVSECKRLQTVPEWYDFSCVSDSQAYKMLGNGWTCDVITHLIKACLVGNTDSFVETDFGMQYTLF